MKIFKQYSFNELTQESSIIDDRDFYHCKQFQLKELRNIANKMIISSVPEYKQRNAALGLLSNEETQQIKDSIQAIRTISNQKEAEILAVVWDGQESTRAEACDIVQRIFWE